MGKSQDQSSETSKLHEPNTNTISIEIQNHVDTPRVFHRELFDEVKKREELRSGKYKPNNDSIDLEGAPSFSSDGNKRQGRFFCPNIEKNKMKITEETFLNPAQQKENSPLFGPSTTTTTTITTTTVTSETSSQKTSSNPTPASVLTSAPLTKSRPAISEAPVKTNQVNALVSLDDYKDLAINALLKYCDGWNIFKLSLFGFRWGHHHQDRAWAVVDAIIEANNIESILSILRNQCTLFENPEVKIPAAAVAHIDLAPQWKTTLKNKPDDVRTSGYYHAINEALRDVESKYYTENQSSPNLNIK